MDHLDRMERKRIGIIAVESGNVRFDGVRHCVHTGVSGEFGRHRFREFGIHDRDVGSDVEVGKRVFDALRIVGDDRERGDFGSRARGGRDSAELRLGTKRRERERLNDGLERGIGILVEYPHGFSRVDGRTAAHGNDPVGLELSHGSRALHDGFDRRIRLDVLEESDFHAGFLEIADSAVHESEPLHASAAEDEDSFFTFEVFQFRKGTLAVIEIARQSKTSHISSPFSVNCRLRPHISGAALIV